METGLSTAGVGWIDWSSFVFVSHDRPGGSAVRLNGAVPVGIDSAKPHSPNEGTLTPSGTILRVVSAAARVE